MNQNKFYLEQNDCSLRVNLGVIILPAPLLSSCFSSCKVRCLQTLPFPAGKISAQIPSVFVSWQSPARWLRWIKDAQGTDFLPGWVPSSVLGTAVFFTNPPPEASWHFLEVPRRTPEPEPCPGRSGSEQSSVVLGDSRHLCGRKKRAGKSSPSPCSPQPPVLSAGSFPALRVFPSASVDFSCVFAFPTYVHGREMEQGRSHHRALLLNAHLLRGMFFVFPRAVLFPVTQGTKILSYPTSICLGHFSSFSCGV